MSFECLQILVQVARNETVRVRQKKLIHEVKTQSNVEYCQKQKLLWQTDFYKRRFNFS